MFFDTFSVLIFASISASILDRFWAPFWHPWAAIWRQVGPKWAPISPKWLQECTSKFTVLPPGAGPGNDLLPETASERSSVPFLVIFIRIFTYFGADFARLCQKIAKICQESAKHHSTFKMISGLTFGQF